MNPYYKPLGCLVRKCKPIGPLLLCEKHCTRIDECLELTKVDLAEESIPNAWKKRNRSKKRDPKSRFCLICDQPISRASTPLGPFTGMFFMHLKSKHPEIYRKCKDNMLQHSDLFYIDELKRRI